MSQHQTSPHQTSRPATPPHPARTLGVDTGGTFTDLVEIDSTGRLRFEKAFSTPQAPEQGILNALATLVASEGISVEALLADCARFAHGTTVSTNALIQRRGARVGLITTAGFEDTLIIARGPVGRAGGLPQSKAMDFLHTEPPPPLVPKTMVRGVTERIIADGTVLVALNEREAEEAVRALIAAGAESLAVCLLWSFRNDAHERRIRAIAGGIAPDLPVSLSCEIAPRMGEYERMVTTAVNAFIGPVTERYIASLQSQLAGRGLSRPVQVMKSSGSVMLPDAVAHQAVSVVNSGPIGGLVAARHVGRALGYDRIITADMGGTSFDVGLIVDGVFEEEASPFLAHGLPVHVPTVKVVTIGAGGGSIAWTDGYRLQVGPQSAGSEPGPACYGRGGVEPTVADALVVLGIIDPATFFGGRYPLDPQKARDAIATRIAAPLSLEVVEAAAGIYEVVTAKMADLIRKVTVESGHDPREFCLLSYGGAGGAHCADFAAQLGIKRVIVPYAAPAFSALGVALSDIAYRHVRSAPVALDAATAVETVNSVFAELAERARADMRMSGLDPKIADMRYGMDMRYVGQMNEVPLAWPAGRIEAADVARLRAAFEALYRQRYGAGTVRREAPLEVISFRAEAVRTTEKPGFSALFAGKRDAPERHRRRPVYRREDGWIDAAVVAFDALAPERPLVGPAVIERQSTTIWLPPAARASLDVYGNLAIDLSTA
ncbi:MAG: hydantoinase/oxoprolinase family protein [Hyphomicrobiales bacterium]|nr:hydantoinase/oxoprolinase family protein [Hyphomicrobiales bacterium]